MSASGAAGLKGPAGPVMLASCSAQGIPYRTRRPRNMAWVKLDDHFDEHPKVAPLSDSALALWACTLAYCNRNLTDGFVPFAIVERGRGDAGNVEELVTAGLWELTENGYEVHDFLTFQPSKSRVEAEREAARERMRAARLSGSPELREKFEGSSPNPDPDPVPKPEPKPPVLGSREVGLDLRTSTDFQSVQTVYDHWRQVCGKARANYNRITPQRRKKIQTRLSEFTVEDLCTALDGVARDPWEDRAKHNDLTVVFRSQEQVERFIELAEAPARFATNGRVTAMDMVRRTRDTQRRELDGNAG